MKIYNLLHGEDAAFICDCWEICLATFVNYPSVKDINNILQGKSEFCEVTDAHLQILIREGSVDVGEEYFCICTDEVIEN